MPCLQSTPKLSRIVVYQGFRRECICWDRLASGLVVVSLSGQRSSLADCKSGYQETPAVDGTSPLIGAPGSSSTWVITWLKFPRTKVDVGTMTLLPRI